MYTLIIELQQLTFMAQEIEFGAPDLSFGRYDSTVFCAMPVYIHGSVKDAKFVYEMIAHMLQKAIYEGIILDYDMDTLKRDSLLYNEDVTYFNLYLSYDRERSWNRQ